MKRNKEKEEKEEIKRRRQKAEKRGGTGDRDSIHKATGDFCFIL
jgi:hypothetical protein